MNTWITSDLHIGHVRILEYCRSEFFENLEEMREMIIHNWNSVVDPDDTVYVLGDVVMGQRAENLPHIARLNGHKHLILGNHDYPHPSNKEKFVVKWTPEYEKYFESTQLETFLEIAGRKVLLTHFPASLDHTDEVRYSAFRPTYDGIILHGHLHCTEIFTEPHHIHCGIDADFTEFGVERYHPIPLTVIEQIITEGF